MGCLQSQHGALVWAECSRKSLRSFLYRLVLRPYEVDRLCVIGLTSLVHVSSSVKSCWVAIICSMMMRVWCPQKVSARPDGSRMVVVARSLGWASHTIMGPRLCGGVKCVYPRSCDGVPGVVFCAAYLCWWWSYAEQVKYRKPPLDSGGHLCFPAGGAFVPDCPTGSAMGSRPRSYCC